MFAAAGDTSPEAQDADMRPALMTRNQQTGWKVEKGPTCVRRPVTPVASRKTQKCDSTYDER